MSDLSRRSFLKGTSLVAAGGVLTAAAGGLIGCTSESEAKTPSPAESISWTDEADVVILGTGNAGLCTGVTIMNEELGSCLVLEAAPEEYRGGNSRVSGQLVFCPLSVQGAIDYQTACNLPYVVEADLVKAWAEEICKNKEWLEEVIGLELAVSSSFNPEYDGLPGADEVEVYVNFDESKPEKGKIDTWNRVMAKFEEYNIPAYYDSRAVELVTDEKVGVIGVKTEDGRYFKAKKGVVLACGGFENNPELMNDHYTIGFNDVTFRGTPYNRGDGITMAKRVGADFWHMNAFVGNSKSFNTVKGNDQSYCQVSPSGKDYIIVGPDGMRCMNEDIQSIARHGKINRNGQFINLEPYNPSWLIFGQESFDGGVFKSSNSFAAINIFDKEYPSCEQLLEYGFIKKCNTVEELAAFMDQKPEVVNYTLTRYNDMVAKGVDLDFGRGVERDDLGYTTDNVLYSGKASIKPYDLASLEFPLYVGECATTILNTQGGPRRSARGEVLDIDGNPIPRLYSAGELGTIYCHMYNGGGNYSEAMSSGRIAARNVTSLDAWE